MNFDFIIDKFFETKLVKGYPVCPDCPPAPCTGDCCDGSGSGGGPCPCCDGAGGPPGGGPGPLGGAPGGQVEVQEVEDFFMAVGEIPSPMSDTGPCPDCDSCGGGGGGGGGIPVNVFPGFIPNPNPPPEPALFPNTNYNEPQLQWCIFSFPIPNNPNGN